MDIKGEAIFVGDIGRSTDVYEVTLTAENTRLITKEEIEAKKQNEIETRVFCIKCKYFRADLIAVGGAIIGRAHSDYPYSDYKYRKLYKCWYPDNMGRADDPILGKAQQWYERPKSINCDMHCSWYEGK